MCQCGPVGCHKCTLWAGGRYWERPSLWGPRMGNLCVFTQVCCDPKTVLQNRVYFQKLPASASEQDKCRSDQRARIPRGWLNREQLSGFCHHLIRPRGILPAAAGKFREGKSRGLAHPAHTDGQSPRPAPRPLPAHRASQGRSDGKANVPRGRRRASALFP